MGYYAKPSGYVNGYEVIRISNPKISNLLVQISVDRRGSKVAALSWPEGKKCNCFVFLWESLIVGPNREMFFVKCFRNICKCVLVCNGYTLLFIQ